ncbi:MAG: sulfotransferase [Pseudomonadota bacterium]
MNSHAHESGILLSRADALLGQGRPVDAIPLYRLALKAVPNEADGWFNLAYALRLEGIFGEALQAYAQALAHGVGKAWQVHLNRAVIFSDHLRRDEEAEAELQQALRLKPDYAPALLNLGNLQEERGRRDAAIDSYTRLLDLPVHATGELAQEALARLLHLKPPGSASDVLLLRLRAAAEATAAMPDSLRATLCFALGRALDSLGDYEGAFAAFARGKHCAHRAQPAYDRRQAAAAVDALITAFPAPMQPQATPAMEPQPLFICGMFRSGSTLLEQILAAHSHVAMAGEQDLLPRMVAGALKPFPASVSRLDDGSRTRLAAQYHEQLLARLPAGWRESQKSYATDKRPDNYLLIGLIKQLFPRARILHTVRHPLDNGLSVFMQHLNPRLFGYAGTLADIGHHFGQYRRLMAHWKALYPDDIHDFDYDAFVAAPEATLRPLLAFIGLPWQDRCLAFHKLDNTVKTASYWQVRKPLYGEASGRWRRYQGLLGPLSNALAAACVNAS